MSLLDGKVAIVTGGGRGLGRAHCLALAAHGAAVVVNDPGVGLHGESTDQTPAEMVAAEITAAGGRALADHSSVTDWAATEKLIALAATEFGRLDVVVNNAGILRDKMLFSMTEEDFDAVIAVHLKGTFAMTRHACAHWREEAKRGTGRGGRIINTTSGTGLFGTAGAGQLRGGQGGHRLADHDHRPGDGQVRGDRERDLADRAHPDDRRHRRGRGTEPGAGGRPGGL